MQFSLELMKQLKKDQKDYIKKYTLQMYPSRTRPIYAFCPPANDITIIAEIKKASPSNGTIKLIDAAQMALLYKTAGAYAISVLTEHHFFSGNFDDLHHVSQVVDCPILCKDFILFAEQIDCAYNTGADLILLINALYTPEQLQYLYHYTLEKGLMPLIEIHHSRELKPVLSLIPTPQFIMVNMRNLLTLTIEYEVGIETLKAIPHSIHKICASGITNAEMVKHIKEKTNTTTFLVGTSLMQHENPSQLLKELRHVC